MISSAQKTRDEAEAYASSKRDEADANAASILKQATEDADEQINERREAAKKELDGVQQRIADLDAQIAAMQKEDKAAADPKLLRSALRSVVKTLQSPDATVAEKNAAVRSVAENIIWNKAANTLTVHYRLVL